MFLKIIKKNQLAWNVARRLAVFLPKTIFSELPDEIIMEMSAACNLRCPVCPTHFAMSRAKGQMDFELFSMVIDDFKLRAKKPSISMNFAGEPLLNQDIARMVAYAENNGHSTYISTNATLLNRNLSKSLIQAGLSSIHLCIDGFNKKAQESYRVGSNFEEVKANIEGFLEVKRELGVQKPYVSIQTLATSLSEGQIEEMIEWARSHGADAVNFKSFSLGAFTTDEMKAKYAYMLPSDKRFQRKTSNIYKTICSVPRRQSVVYWNGDLGMCCMDFDASIKLPNIKESGGFVKAFQSSVAIDSRHRAFLKDNAICRKCDMSNADFMGVNIVF